MKETLNHMHASPSWRRRELAGLLAAMGALATVPAWAQFRVEVTGVGLTQLPIAIAPFRGDAEAPQKLAAIVQADLERSGQFRAIDATGSDLNETSRPDVTPWRQKGADSLATVELVMPLEEEFACEIPDEDSEKITSVQQAIDYVKAHLKA